MATSNRFQLLAPLLAERILILDGAMGTMIQGRGLEVTLCDVTSRERRAPHFEIVTAHAARPRRASRV